MNGLLLGFGIGVGLGVLFAPRKGEETRNSLSAKASHLADSAKDRLQQGREKVQAGVNRIKGGQPRATGTDVTL
jgi:gas vesicle protein